MLTKNVIYMTDTKKETDNSQDVQNFIEDILGETYQVDVRDTMPRKVDKSLFFQREILQNRDIQKQEKVVKED